VSGFIRPEVAATLIKWHEVLIAIAAFLLGLYFTQLPGPVVQGLGIVLIFLGLGYVVVGLRRLRFRGSGAAPGAVRITEGQITYLGPLQGGAVALSLITELRLRGPAGSRIWRIQSEANDVLEIPHDAAGAEKMFDVFAALPGMSPEHLLRALRGAQTGDVIVWQRASEPGLTALN